MDKVNVQRPIKLGLGKGLDVTGLQENWNITSLVRARDVEATALEIHVPEIKYLYGQQLLHNWSSIQREMATATEERGATEIHFKTHVQVTNDSLENIIVWKQFNDKSYTFKEPAISTRFETNLCSYLYKQFHDHSKDSLQKSQPVLAINDIILNLKQNQEKQYLEEFTAACTEFIATGRMTHYVHMIELGIMQYSTYSTSEYMKELGPAMGPMGGPLEAGKIISPKAKQKMNTIIEHEAGTSFEGDEVVGFSVLPVYTLVKQKGLREQVKIALGQYIHSKLGIDTSHSYYTIAGVSESSKKVYWTVNQTKEIMGTPLPEQATLFQFQEAATKENPSQFLIRTKITYNSGTPQYYYLKFAADTLGSTTKSLKMTPEIGERFSVHRPDRSSLFCLCAASVRTLQEWKDENEFHLRGSTNNLFVGMKPLKYTESHGTYRICCAPVLQKKDNCTLFCITSESRSDAASYAGHRERDKLKTLMEASQQS